MEGMFHADGGYDDCQESGEKRKWCDISAKKNKQWERAPYEKLKEARRNSMTEGLERD